VRFLFRSRLFRAVEGAATKKIEDSTALTRCKEKCPVANVGCDVIHYTTPGVLGAAFSPLQSSHTATVMLTTSLANLLTDTRRSHQLSGSKSPSFAPETLTRVWDGKTCVKM